MTLTEIAAHIRKRIRHEGIKARVRVAPGGGHIQVNAPAFGVQFTEAEQRTIRLIAKVNRLTWSRGLPIDPEQMTNPETFSFYAAASPQVEPTPEGPQYVMPGCQHSARQAAAARDAAGHGRLSNQPQFPVHSGLFAQRQPEQIDIEQAIAETQERST